MIKTFDTLKEARKRFKELQYAVSESCGEREFYSYHEDNGDDWKMHYTRCGCDIIVDCNAFRISRLETLDKIRELFDEVVKNDNPL